MDLTIAIADYLALKHPYLSPKTYRWYAHKLAIFAQWGQQSRLIVDTSDFRATHIGAFLDHLKQTDSPNFHRSRSSYTLHGYTQVLRQFAGWLDDEGLTPKKVNVEHERVDVKVIKPFTTEHIGRLMVAAGTQPNHRLAARDQAMLALLLDTGIRASECVNLEVDWLHLDVSDSYIKVYGKRRKEREVNLGVKCRSLLSAYLHRWRPAGNDLPYVFLSIESARLTTDGLRQAIDRLCERAGGRVAFPGVRVSAHTFRHTFALRQLEAGTDIVRLSRLLGHSNIVTTELYLRAFQARDARRSVQSVMDHLRDWK